MSTPDGFQFLRDREPEGTFYADCQFAPGAERICDWDYLAIDENLAKIAAVLHVLTKHPEEYQRITGNDPDEKKVEYAEMIRALQKVL